MILFTLFLIIFSNQLKCMNNSNLSSNTASGKEEFLDPEDPLFMLDNNCPLAKKINQQLLNPNIEQADYNKKFLNIVYKEIFPQAKYQYHSENLLQPFIDTLSERDEKNKKEIIGNLYPILFEEQIPVDANSEILMTDLKTRFQQKNISHQEFLKTIDQKIKEQQKRVSTAFAEGILTCLAVVCIFWIKSYFSK